MQSFLKTDNAVAAIRVSSVKQGTDGDSPEAQNEQLKQFAKLHDINLVKTFTFLESASKLAQPMQEAIDYCKDPKNDVQLFIIKSIDRFTRGGATPYDQLKMQLEKYGVKLVDIYGVISSEKVNTLEHLNVKYKWSEYSPSQKTEFLEAERAKDELRDIMSRMIGAQIRYARMGYWIRPSIYGYRNVKIETSNGKRCIMKPNSKEEPFVTKMFELRCQGTLTDQEIVDEVNRMGYVSRVGLVRSKVDRTTVIGKKGGVDLNIKVLWRIIQNPVYAGINPEKWTQDKPAKCKFPGLISIETFNKANHGKIIITEKDGEIAITRRKTPEYLLKKGVRNADFPYKRYVMCPHCVKPLYGSASRGRLGTYYPAYHCSGRGHNFRVTKKEFDKTISSFVGNIRVSPARIEELNKVILDEWQKRQEVLEKDDNVLDHQIAALKIEARMTIDKMKFLSSELAIKYMEEDLIKIEEQITNLELEKEQKVQKKPMNKDVLLGYLEYFLEHLDLILLQQIDTVNRANYFGAIFDKLPTYTEILFGTRNLDKLTGINEVFTLPKLSKSHMVQGVGFEPTKA